MDLKLIRNQFFQNHFLSTHNVITGFFNRESGGTVRLVYVPLQLSENQRYVQHQAWGFKRLLEVRACAEKSHWNDLKMGEVP